MSYTPVELRHVRVGRSLFGYNRAMVEEVIEEVAQSFEATWRERSELADKVEGLEKQLDQLKQREDLLTQTLLAAEQAASDVRERARREAELIINEAHTEAREVGRKAVAERERLETESRRIEAMLRSALAMIDERSVAAATAPVPAPPVSAPKAVEATPSPVPAPVILAPVAPLAPAPVPLPPMIDDDVVPESWQREDTREFEPISMVEPVEEAAPEHDHESEDLDENDHSDGVGEPVLQRLPGSESRDFDWGE